MFKAFVVTILLTIVTTVNSSSRVDMRCDIVQSASVPYTDKGDLSGDNVGGNVSMTLDLRQGQRIVTREGREGAGILSNPESLDAVDTGAETVAGVVVAGPGHQGRAPHSSSEEQEARRKMSLTCVVLNNNVNVNAAIPTPILIPNK